MKKVLLLLVLFVLLSVGAPVYATDIDGVWAGSTPQGETFFAMVRENSGNVVVAILAGENMNAWIPFFGPFDGTAGQLSQLFSSQANGNISESFTGTFRLTSPTTATFTATSCTNFPQQDNCPPVGTVLNLSKIF